ncbi:MAG: histidine--tRNA ligase [Flavobacteriales bacterium]|nr:histidine--tRNA ligase [Flavobacteriales bacterium]|tara:strand:+ start:21448 stop:22800 length:1353 start_codon:yes stop_codon:yes gene_type:complete
MKKNFSLSGMPDFNTLQIKRREFLISIIKKKFQSFGFKPIATSLIEKRDNLFGSYGTDGDKLIYQIVRSGDYLNKLNIDFQNINYNELSQNICDKALRYDLTIPFARFIASNQADINFPFKRYEVGSVFRADRPQKGRFRQFTQCDADIIGSNSLWLEIELINLIDSVISEFGLNDLTIKINNRKILEGVFESFSSNLDFSNFCIILDKLDKIGFNGVRQLFLTNGFVNNDLDLLCNLFELNGSFLDKKEFLLSKFKINSNLEKGLNELSFIFNKINIETIKQNIEIDFSLARGLDYYTGTIFELVTSNFSGSLAGGGRYDQLTEKFDLKDLSGVGISFGLDRLCLLLEQSNLFPLDIDDNIDFVFLNFGDQEADVAQSYIIKLRDFSVSAELYPDKVKINKQMKYAHKRGAKFVVMIGEQEMKQSKMLVKNMSTGEQQVLTFKELINTL